MQGTEVPSAINCEQSTMSCELSAMNCELSKPGGGGGGGGEAQTQKLRSPLL